MKAHMKNRSDSSMLVSDHRRQMLSWQVVKSTFLSNVARLAPPLLKAQSLRTTALTIAAMATSGDGRTSRGIHTLWKIRVGAS